MRIATIGHQCPECVAEGRRTQRPARTALGGGAAGRGGYVTKTLIGLNAAVAVIVAVVGGTESLAGGAWGGLLGGSTEVHQHFAMLGYASYFEGGPPHGVAAGEYYRLFTAMFLHFGIIHLLMNMWALWILGRPLEAWFGSARFLGIYLVCGLGGNVAAYVFQPYALSAGASTAIFGLFAVLFVALRRMRLSTSSVLPIIIINLIFTISVPGISIAGHLGGLVTGAVIGAGVAYAPLRNRTLIQAGTLLGAVALLSLLTVWQTTQLTGGSRCALVGTVGTAFSRHRFSVPAT
jgi:membrane associated rhomboid family serine protease